MTLTIKFGRDKLALDLPDGDELSIAQLRQAIADKTHLPLNAFKLIHAGAVVKNDNAKLSTYRITQKSTLVLIPSAPPPQPTTASINTELERVRSQLQPSVDAFVQSTSKDPKEHARLSELLLQSLLALDAIDIQKMSDDARLERKGAVNEVQGLLDQVDGAWRDRNSKH
ncbi:hypothetical protein HGRIS_002559 [Hohenbuehelia grisea]|uniref:BAG domain-containing protein n=1 Tax=Hohenbuehelia grisea TaxID=104357 RepID=A0ABR3JMY0_9AGAR